MNVMGDNRPKGWAIIVRKVKNMNTNKVILSLAGINSPLTVEDCIINAPNERGLYETYAKNTNDTEFLNSTIGDVMKSGVVSAIVTYYPVVTVWQGSGSSVVHYAATYAEGIRKGGEVHRAIEGTPGYCGTFLCTPVTSGEYTVDMASRFLSREELAGITLRAWVPETQDGRPTLGKIAPDADVLKAHKPAPRTVANRAPREPLTESEKSRRSANYKTSAELRRQKTAERILAIRAKVASGE